MNNKSFRIYNENRGFIMFNGVLTEITLIKSVFNRNNIVSEDEALKTVLERQNADADDTSVTTYYKTSDGVEHDFTFREDDEFRVFKSVSDYEGNKLLSSKDISPFAQRPSGFEQLDKAFIFQNGCPVEFNLQVYHIEYDYIRRMFVFPYPCDNMYKTRGECIDYNEYEVQNLDGTKEMRKGIVKLLMLDEDQKELLKTLKETLDKLAKEKVSLIVDGDGSVSAFNKRNVSDFVCDCDLSSDDRFDEYDDVTKYRYENLFYQNDFVIDIYSSDFDVMIERK